MKTCRECGIEKPLADYYVHKQMADGHLNKCKSCVKLRVSINLEKNADYYREYEKRRANLPHRVEARKQYAKTENGKIAKKRASKKYAETNPLRRAAQIIVGNAVRDGKLIRQPCLVCGDKAQAHHPDYSSPLDVVWLCRFHHIETHKIK